MSFFSRIFGRKKADTVTPVVPAPSKPGEAQAERSYPQISAPARAAEADDARAPSTTDILRGVAARLENADKTTPPGVWEMDAPSTADLLARANQAEPAAGGGAGPAKRPRNKTRLLGFDTSAGDATAALAPASAMPEPAEEPAAEAVATAGPAMFPTGFVLIVEGPGRGSAFPIFAGMSSIGRGADQTVRLDFGDATISRAGHAAIVYDTESREFLLGHGGKSNIVRLNGSPVISNEALSSGDEIRLGETTLRFVAICGDQFDWADTDEGEDDDDLAIA
ncbi:FHA domain-containing protein [Jannaschia aquimarina]|uniref:FHA domain protein n=1 Tax=Jannaschia aquimarina TaxID=935700 RepID=A0A0D1EHJ0_9RHOB|nr:FHA domain-containing protein [Jannaschia aquimarina]KIT15280.1 FHA domain protein [Jannaschia aquimarina]SNT25439.1 FHA domain-containing protein [Jannaschia aquimarina]